MKKVFLVLLIVLLAACVSAVDNTLYHRCTDAISVDINNNTFTIDMPGRTVDLSCGQQLSRNYDIEFYEDITAQCKSDEILGNFTVFFERFGKNFQTFMNSYNNTPNYYDKYLVCKTDLSSTTTSLSNCNSKEAVKDYKSDYDTCTSQKIVLEGQKSQSDTANSQCQVKLAAAESESGKFKDQRFLFLGAGLIAGAAGLHFSRKKDRKVAESPAQRQLPSSR